MTLNTPITHLVAEVNEAIISIYKSTDSKELIPKQHESVIVKNVLELTEKVEDVVSKEYDGYDVLTTKIREKVESVNGNIISLSLLKSKEKVLDALFNISGDCSSLVVIFALSPFLRMVHFKEVTCDLVRSKTDIKDFPQILFTVQQYHQLLKSLANDSNIDKGSKDKIEAICVGLENKMEMWASAYRNKQKQDGLYKEVLEEFEKCGDVVLEAQKVVEKVVENYTKEKMGINQQLDKIRDKTSDTQKKAKNEKTERIEQLLTKEEREEAKSESEKATDEESIEKCQQIVAESQRSK
ncbi:hypothetical protein EIN_130210 [Entamoeba invadens IP1]|uniref:Uncharacterized protein n=1 Tax=Entamoeba invadens IP1 TaxID=370355 RepID=A0A0A1UCY6_ENTIV|nr:hypothetical protein EIN_130210 [Entamoeba invadens IP1]ELP94302.1 hypothetical protein EIN_130210 [Entamoeba invadens IP1]|eukprot:XP_004261073.1 hypothetical protein EIN_130210 [Entamoeba invadens IP1]